MSDHNRYRAIKISERRDVNFEGGRLLGGSPLLIASGEAYNMYVGDIDGKAFCFLLSVCQEARYSKRVYFHLYNYLIPVDT